MKKNIYSILKGTFLVNDDSFKNWRFIIFISGLALIMIASSHSADKKVYEIARLMRMKMESSITLKMQEKGLSQSVIPPKKIKVKSQK